MMDSSARVAGLSLKEKIGQMLVVGFAAGVPGEESLRRVVEESCAGNVILFARNAADSASAAASAGLARSVIGEQTGIPPLVCIDQEGGIVARIGSGITPLPGAMALGAGASPGEIRELCEAVARDLLSLGIDWNLGPVADVNVNPANPVIGVRSFGEDPRLVSDCARAWFEGMRSGGILCCAKHFPGHGDTRLDSHLELPEVPHPMERLEQVELLPFVELIAAGIPSILTAHVRFPAVEARALPATLSRAVIGGLLRERLGFRGIVVTDCMEMKAIADGFPDAAVMAVEAGADMIIVSHSPGLQIDYARKILEAVRSGRLAESRIDESLARILAMKALAAEARRPSASGAGREARAGASPAALELARRLSERSLCLAGGDGYPDLSGGGFYVDILPAGFSRVEDASLGQPVFPDSILGALSPDRWEGFVLPVKSSEGERGRCLAALEGFLVRRPGSPVVFGLYNASSDPAQAAFARELMRRSGEVGSPFALVATRNPYDIGQFPRVPALLAFEYTPLSRRCVAAFLDGDIRASFLRDRRRGILAG
jgi:beta-N-acetylhexosaminidase